MNYREEIRFTIENSFKLEYNNKKKNVFRGDGRHDYFIFVTELYQLS